MDHEDHDADELEVVKVTSMPTPDTISSLLRLSAPSDCGANADHDTAGPSTDADADVAAEEVRLVRNDAMSLLGYDVATLQARATARARERLRLKGLSLVADKTGEEGCVDVDANGDAPVDGNPACGIDVPDPKPKAVTGAGDPKLPSHSLPMEPEEVMSGSPPANLFDQARELASAHSDGDGGSDGGGTCHPRMQRPMNTNDQNAVSPCFQRPPSSGWQGRSYKKQKCERWPQQHHQQHVHHGTGVNAGLPTDNRWYPHAAGPPPHQPIQPSHHPYASHNYFSPREIHGTRTSCHIGGGGGLEGGRYACKTDAIREQKCHDPSEEWRSKLKDSAHRAMDRLRARTGTSHAPPLPTDSPSHRGRMMNDHSNPGPPSTWYSNGVNRGGLVPVRAAPNSAFEYTNSKVESTATKHNNDFAPPHSSLPGRYAAAGTEALQRRSVLLARLRGDATLPPRSSREAAGMGGMVVERQPEHHDRTSRHEDWFPRTTAAAPPFHCPDPERGKEEKSPAKEKTYPRSNEALPDKKPKRPLTPYILFFRVERSRILGKPITLDEASKMIDESVTGKRRHRKSHGKIGFKEMSMVISTKWRRMDKKEKDVYYKQAKKLVIAYDKEKLAWETARLICNPPPPDPAEKKSAQPAASMPTLKSTPAMELPKSPPDTVIAYDKEKLAWETERLNYNPPPLDPAGNKSAQPTASTPTLPPTPAMELPKSPPDTEQDEDLSHSRSVGDNNHKRSIGAVVRICLNGTKRIWLDGTKPVSFCLASSSSFGEDEDGVVKGTEGGGLPALAAAKVATSDADAQCPRPATTADFEPPH